MKIARARPNVFELTLTSTELSALLAAARLTAEAMARDPSAPAETLETLTRLLADYDRALERLREQDGREKRPSEDSPQ